MTRAADGLDHLVTAEAMAAGQVARTGVYDALCEARVLATSMMTPPGSRYRGWRAILTASTSRSSRQGRDVFWVRRVWRRVLRAAKAPTAR